MLPAGMEPGFRKIVPDACGTGVTEKLPWLVRKIHVRMRMLSDRQGGGAVA